MNDQRRGRALGPRPSGQGATPRGTSVLQLHVRLEHIEPAIWRSVLVPERFTLAGLHRVIQEVFGWQDRHLYDFTIGDTRYESPHPEAEGADPRRTTLLALKLERGHGFVYTYDFGDWWSHMVRVESRQRAEPEAQYPWCLDGERAGPPEDCGGHPGYEDLVRILGEPSDPAFADMVA